MRKNMSIIVVLLSIVLLQGCLYNVKPIQDCHTMKLVNNDLSKTMIYYVAQVNHKFYTPGSIKRAVGELKVGGIGIVCFEPNVFRIKWKEQGKSEPWLKEGESFTLNRDRTFVYP